MTEPPRPARPTLEFVALMALLTSSAAMGTDLMLPALDVIGRDLGAGAGIDVHYIIVIFFLGLSAGQLVVGPLSDAVGRKPVIYGGYAILVLGCLLSMTAQSWTAMLIGRALQGLGSAAPRIVAMALVRDQYKGSEMARILSLVMSVFIIVPIVAPAVGQGLMSLGDWTWTFGALAAMAVVITIWFGLRQQETLTRARRRPFRPREIWHGVREIFATRVTLGYTVTLGLVFGSFVGYLGSAQRIFQDTFGAGDLFVVYFALAAAAIGGAALCNAVLVMRFGSARLSWVALLLLTGLSALFLCVLPQHAGVPPLALFLVWQLSTFFCVGILFGNLNALAMEPLGTMAGLGAAVVGSVATLMSLPFASVIGQGFDGTVYPLVIGFAALGAAACVVMWWTGRAASRDG